VFAINSETARLNGGEILHADPCRTCHITWLRLMSTLHRTI